MAQAVAPKSAPAPLFRYAHNVYFQDGLALTVILSALLFLVLGVSLDAAGHVPQGMGIVVPVTMAAIGLGALMSFSRFDSFFALSHALFTGLAVILFLMARLPNSDEIAPFLDKGVPALQARAYFVLLRLLNWVDAAMSGSASADNYVFIFEIAFLLWWLAFLGMWSILRHGYLWRAVVPAAVVLVANAYFAPQPVWALLGLFSVLALFLLVRAHLSEQQLRWREQQVHVSHDIGWDYVRTGLTYSVIVLTLAWLLPGLGRNVQMRQLLSPLNQRWEQASQDLNRLYQGLNRRELPASNAFGRSLTLGGARNVGDSLVFNARTAQARYWRAVVFDTYTGKGWLNTNTLQTPLPVLQPAPIAGWDARAPLTQTITLMAPMGNVLLGVPDIRQLNLAADVLVGSAPGTPLEAPALGEGAPPAVDLTMVRARQQLDSGDSYTVLSNATDVTQDQLEAASTNYPPEIQDRYLQLPAGFSPRVAALAQSLTVTATTPYQKAKAIEGYLRTIPYNDAIEAPPPDADPLEYFLFDIRQGYCDYYASAMAMMLRSVGVPARTASGYAEGMLDDETGLYYITERDAHTWVEAFFPNLGWIEFEPTASESPLNRPTGGADPSATLNEEQSPTPAPNQDQLPPQEQPQPDQGAAFGEDAAGETGGLPWWLAALLTPVVLIAGLWLLWRTQWSGPTAFTPDLPVILFERLQRWGARLGLAPQPHQTPYEQARTWGKALPEGAAPIRRITAAYVLHRFSGRAPQPGAAQPAPDAPPAPEAAAWATLQPVLIKAWLRKWLPFTRKRKDVYELKG